MVSRYSRLFQYVCGTFSFICNTSFYFQDLFQKRFVKEDDDKDFIFVVSLISFSRV